MTKISKEDVLKIAAMSHIDVDEAEIPGLIQQLQDVLTYAERVQQIVIEGEDAPIRNINVVRDDMVKPSDAHTILERAPQREDSLFVVPSILEDK